MIGRRTIKSFAEKDSYTYKQELSNRLANEVLQKPKEYILGIDENEYKNYLIDKYTLEPLMVDFESEIIEEPHKSKEWVDDRFYRERYQTDVYTFTIKYNFSGSAELFGVRPDTWTMTTTEIHVDEQRQKVSFSFKLYTQNADDFHRGKSDFQNRAFANLKNINHLVSEWNRQLPVLAENAIQNQRQKYTKENSFFAAINIKVNQETKSVFSTPTIKKKIIPQPTLNPRKEFSSEPMMSKEMYEDVLKVVYESGKNMEKKPALYQGKDEEGLRDQFLFVLETRYEATTATGETFNRSGKTDIILKYANDGSNLFVAECKFWRGASEFLKAISQLFDRYLTWRDSKTSLIMFVDNKDFTNVINTALSTIKTHPYYIQQNGQRGETSFSYIFRLPQDVNKQVFLELLLFHYDK